MIPKKYILDGKEVTKSDWDTEFELQTMLFGTCIHRTALLQDGTFIIELIDYRKVWDRIGGPKPVDTK